MTDSNEVNESCKDKPELVKEMDVGDEKHKVGREEVEEDDEEEEEEEEEEEIEEETEESDEDEEDEQEKEVQPGSEDVSDDSRSEVHAEVSLAKNPDENMGSPADAVVNSKAVHVGTVEKPRLKDEKEALRPDTEGGGDAKLDGHDSPNHLNVDDEITPRSHAGVDAHINESSALKVELMKEDLKNEANTKEGTMDVENGNPNLSCIFDTDTSGGGESGTEDEQAAFMNELEKFHKEKFLEFKPPKFYGEPLNLLKLWRAVMRLGGYDKVTACKYWRQVGESFKPPKTCTTVSWTFRIFYEKALLEYERYRTSGDGTGIPTSLPAPMSVENQVSGSGRARRDAAARAMQGWHSQRILDNGEVSDPIIKDKNTTSLSKREKQLKNLGMLKRKKPSSMDAAVKDVRAKVPKTHQEEGVNCRLQQAKSSLILAICHRRLPKSETTVIDIGSPADWVKINVRVTKDCYEVYALVPGLLREEVRVQSDPAGRLVISGEPENPDNPWSVTPFKKVVNLPSRIDPHQTSAVVTLHGQLFVRVPFEQYD